MNKNPQERVRPRPPTLVIAILCGVLALLYLPLLIMITNSFISKTEQGLILTLRWYQEVFADQVLLEAMGRSLFVGIASATIATILGSLAAIAVARSHFKFRLPLEFMSFISLIIPELVFALSLLSWFFILHIQLSLTTVIVAHVTFCLSFVMITVGSRVATLDISIEDAARDLGASEFSILKSITLPLLKPAIGAAFVLSFLLSFDDFLITFYTNGSGTDTLPIKLYTAMKVGITPKLSAMSTLMFLFTLALILLGLRGRALRDLVGVKD
jgi:spermidine/putrescine transport system permease protein